MGLCKILMTINASIRKKDLSEIENQHEREIFACHRIVKFAHSRVWNTDEWQTMLLVTSLCFIEDAFELCSKINIIAIFFFKY